MELGAELERVACPCTPRGVCALRLKEVYLLALSDQQGRGNFPRTR